MKKATCQVFWQILHLEVVIYNKNVIVICMCVGCSVKASVLLQSDVGDQPFYDFLVHHELEKV